MTDMPSNTRRQNSAVGWTRRSLLSAAVAAGVFKLPARRADAQSAAEASARPGAEASLSRQFGRWAAALEYADLPADVVDRAKGVTLQALVSILLGSRTDAGRQALALVRETEGGVGTGATVLVDGTTVTVGGAAFANAEMALAGGKWDTFRMLTHPGSGIVPAALAAAALSSKS